MINKMRNNKKNLKIKETSNGLPVVSKKTINLLKGKSLEFVIRKTSEVIAKNNPLLYYLIRTYSDGSKDFKNVYLSGTTLYYFLYKQDFYNFKETGKIKGIPYVRKETIDDFMNEKSHDAIIEKDFKLLRKENFFLYMVIHKYLNNSKEKSKAYRCASIVYGLLNRQALYNKIYCI